MHKNRPWWKYGHVWMVIGGPAVVVVASFITFYLAARNPDIVQMDNGAHVAGADKLKGRAAHDLAPAGLARNHAQTGVPEKVLQSNR